MYLIIQGKKTFKRYRKVKVIGISKKDFQV